MSLANKISVFTTAIRSEFTTAYEATAVPAQYLNYTTVIPSTGRFENYPWLSPTAGIAQYRGSRRIAKISTKMYTVENLEYDSSFEVLLRDIRDDQTGGYMLKSRELAERAQKFPGRQVLTNAAQGKTLLCFDGSAMFADSHNIGTGDNLMSKDCASNDSTSHNIMAFITVAPVKPLIWQQRQEPVLETDLDETASKWSKRSHWWIDMEGAAAFGRWQDAILYQITDTPSLTELQTILGEIEDRFRTFKLPTGLSGDTSEYIHEQLVFSPQTCTLVVSSALGNLMRQVLHSDTIVQSGAAVTNIYKGFADLVVSGLINTVS